MHPQLSEHELFVLMKCSYDPVEFKSQCETYLFVFVEIHEEYFICTRDEHMFIIYRGTKEFIDIFTDLSIFLGMESFSPRFRRAREVVNHQRLTWNKPIVAIGHSLGGALAEISGADHVIVYNKAIGLGSIFKNIPENEEEIRTDNDMVSFFSFTQKHKNKVYKIKSHTKNIFRSHALENLHSMQTRAKKRKVTDTRIVAISRGSSSEDSNH
jgi:hypothetical protein